MERVRITPCSCIVWAARELMMAQSTSVQAVVRKSRCMQKVATQQRCSDAAHHGTLELASKVFRMMCVLKAVEDIDLKPRHIIVSFEFEQLLRSALAWSTWK